MWVCMLACMQDACEIESGMVLGQGATEVGKKKSDKRVCLCVALVLDLSKFSASSSSSFVVS